MLLTEWCFGLEGHYLPGRRMLESNRFGMQVESVLSGSIKVIAFDRCVQPKVMCRMHPQLMRPSCYRMETYDSLAIHNIENLVCCKRIAAIFMTDNLTRPILQVNPQRQINGTLIRENAGNIFFKNRYVSFGDRFAQKLFLDEPICVNVQCNHHQS